ncbi:hypothetical protein VIBHAR_02839 [Vibrio campbellii ATCC BAA-1116]|uniref:Uncharacterized protein n=1 Tax=Vibrio campbellii (strain ATCC BAA-1116) TaxID=2902295 RepID=A7MUQ5_VIBC1|nr:hypothetical protein VIBHAR_02839 [Vibrio campbellii ATCC BAA-1116]
MESLSLCYFMPNLDELKSKTSTGGGYKPVDDTVNQHQSLQN